MLTGLQPGRQTNLFADQLPSFQRPGAAHDRIGVVDVGSNSVRMVVFEGGRRCPAMVFNEKVMCGLGAELADTGKLAPEGVERALRAIKRFVTLAPGLRVGALAGVATAAVRDATDGQAFCRRVARETNVRLDVASGEDEARLAALGVLFGDPSASGLVVDLGGASMELCPVGKGKTGAGVSTPLGPLRFRKIGSDDARKAIAETLQPHAELFGQGAERLYLVGGAWRALGRVQIARSKHPLSVLHEFAFTSEEAAEVAEFVQSAGRDGLAEIPGIPSGRIGTLPYAALLLDGLLNAFEPMSIMISGFGLREGICYECLPMKIRREDPLISTTHGLEITRSRAPGFGAELGNWMLAAVAPENEQEDRLVRAACHLADVCWRAHPDYRARACVEMVTRVNVSSIGHVGRARMAGMLLARYKGARKAFSDEPILDLLDKATLARSASLGAVMRLGVTIAGATPGVLEHCPLSMEDGVLTLTPDRMTRPIMGEEVEKRLGQAAKAMGLEGVVAA